jgi:hypothetical protein
MFLEIIFPRFGVPRVVIRDGVSHFIDKTFRKCLSELEVDQRVAIPYHPQTSGQAETSKKQIKNILQKNSECHREGMEEQITQGTLGISDSFQDADRNDTVPTRLWQNLPSSG